MARSASFAASALPVVRVQLGLLLSLAALVVAAQQPKPKSPAGYVDAIAAHARDLIHQGKISDALPLLSALEKRGASDPEAEFAAGEILQELGALRAEQLQRVAPDSAEAHELLGKSLEAQGKLEQALTEYQRASEKAPAKPGLHFLIGNVEWKLQRLEDAQREFGAELKANPHHAMANLRMGQILLDTQRESASQAVACLREAVAGAPASLEAHRELGKALRLAHQFPEAEKELRLVESRAPSDPTVHAQLAALYKEMGEQEKAREEITIHARILREKLEASRKAHSPQTP
jgi:Flp pilus assembly protein TadD